MVPIIPMTSNNKKENKEFDKLAQNYRAMVYIACTFIWCKAK